MEEALRIAILLRGGRNSNPNLVDAQKQFDADYDEMLLKKIEKLEKYEQYRILPNEKLRKSLIKKRLRWMRLYQANPNEERIAAEQRFEQNLEVRRQETPGRREAPLEDGESAPLPPTGVELYDGFQLRNDAEQERENEIELQTFLDQHNIFQRVIYIRNLEPEMDSFRVRRIMRGECRVCLVEIINQFNQGYEYIGNEDDPISSNYARKHYYFNCFDTISIMKNFKFMGNYIFLATQEYADFAIKVCRRLTEAAIRYLRVYHKSMAFMTRVINDLCKEHTLIHNGIDSHVIALDGLAWHEPFCSNTMFLNRFAKVTCATVFNIKRAEDPEIKEKALKFLEKATDFMKEMIQQVESISLPFVPIQWTTTQTLLKMQFNTCTMHLDNAELIYAIYKKCMIQLVGHEIVDGLLFNFEPASAEEEAATDSSDDDFGLPSCQII